MDEEYYLILSQEDEKEIHIERTFDEEEEAMVYLEHLYEKGLQQVEKHEIVRVSLTDDKTRLVIRKHRGKIVKWIRRSKNGLK